MEVMLDRDWKENKARSGALGQDPSDRNILGSLSNGNTQASTV